MTEEEYNEIMEAALASWEHPEAWDEAERNWRDRNPQLRDDERI